MLKVSCELINKKRWSMTSLVMKGERCKFMFTVLMIHCVIMDVAGLYNVHSL